MNMLVTKQIPLPVQSLPSQYAPFVKPLSYEFRVAEIIEDGRIETVKLQMQVWEHDNYGSGHLKQDWTVVERVQIEL